MIHPQDPPFPYQLIDVPLPKNSQTMRISCFQWIPRWGFFERQVPAFEATKKFYKRIASLEAWWQLDSRRLSLE